MLDLLPVDRQDCATGAQWRRLLMQLYYACNNTVALELGGDKRMSLSNISKIAISLRHQFQKYQQTFLGGLYLCYV